MGEAEDTEDRSLAAPEVLGCLEDSVMAQEAHMDLDHLADPAITDREVLAGLVITDREDLEDTVLTEALLGDLITKYNVI